MTDDLGYNHVTGDGSDEPSLVTVTVEPETPSGPAFDDFILYRIRNGNFSQPPPEPGSDLALGTNEVPNWVGPFGGWSASYVESASYPGAAIRFTTPLLSGEVGSPGYVEQVVPIGGDYFRALGNAVRLAINVVTKPGSSIVVGRIDLQYLDKDDNEVGSATFASSTGADLASAFGNAITGGSPPATAAKLRVRVGVDVISVGADGTATIDLVDVRNDPAFARVLFAELFDPASYAAGFLSQRNGLAIIGGDGQTRAIAIPEATLPTPASGFGAIGPKSTGRWYVKDDAGNERQIDDAADHLADTSDAHDASAISIVDAGGLYTGTDVEAALAEVFAAKQPLDSDLTTFAGLTNVLAATAWPTPPALLFGGNQVGMTTSAITHEYFRIGPFIFARGRITLTAKGSSTGTATIANLPVANGAIVGGADVPFSSGMVLTGKAHGRITAATTSIILEQSAAGGSTVLTDAHFTNASDIVFWALYLA